MDYRESLDILSERHAHLDVRSLLKVIGMLELLRNLSGTDNLYTQRIVGLSRMTQHEDVLDCKYVRLALVDLLENHSGDLESAAKLINEINEVVGAKSL